MHKYKMEANEVMFTSDQHFGHENIIRFCNRPFKDVDHMNEVMVERWNAVVDEDQTVFHLGDFSYRGRDRTVPSYLNRLNGNVILIRGNHDKPRDEKHFVEAHDLAEVMVGDQRIIMFHYAMTVWNHSFRGSWMIHGHSHGTLAPRWDRKITDVGVDSWGFKPISFFQLEKEMLQHGEETVQDLDSGFTKRYGKEASLLK